MPGDLSSAAFWMAAAAGMPGRSTSSIEGVGLNPTRIAHPRRRCGGPGPASRPRSRTAARTAASRAGRIGSGSRLPPPSTIEPAEVAGLIDELPALAALATFGGTIAVSGAGELASQGKRPHRRARRAACAALGADVDEAADGFVVRGTRRLRGGTADAAGDHRLAMAFAIAALGAEGPTVIRGADAVDVSYPGFFETLASLTG